MNLSPVVCGRWDGCSIWIQWDSATGATGAVVRVRLRPGAHGVPLRSERERSRMEWREWQEHPVKERDWLALPLWRYDWDAEVEVRAEGGELWERADEVTFEGATCVFEFYSQAGAALPAGEVIGAVVDGAACVYKTRESLVLPPGEAVRCECVAVHGTGWAHLDKAGDFLQEARGIRVGNVEPSVNALRRTGRTFTTLERIETPGPLAMVRMGKAVSPKR